MRTGGYPVRRGERSHTAAVDDRYDRCDTTASWTGAEGENSINMWLVDLNICGSSTSPMHAIQSSGLECRPCSLGSACPRKCSRLFTTSTMQCERASEQTMANAWLLVKRAAKPTARMRARTIVVEQSMFSGTTGGC